MTTSLTDPLVRSFEEMTVDPAQFRHRQHLYVAWCYLRELPLEDALARYVRHLRALTTALGAPRKFHATITWTYMIMLARAMRDSPGATFDELLACHPGLLDHATGVIHAHYDRAELETEEARRHFVLPRRG